MTPEVSVLMAVRNGERWLEEACRSVLTQTLSELELIVIDDGSSDSTPKILNDLTRHDSRVRWEKQQPQGVVVALNRAIALARAPLLARLDADDVALPDRLAVQLEYLKSHADVALLGGWAEKIDGEGRSIGALKPECDAQALAALLPRANPIVSSSVMMRADCVRAVGGYRKVCLSAEDYDLWLRLSEQGPVANLPRLLVRYRVHAGSDTRKSRVRQCFSTRLVRRAATLRRAGAADPINGLAEPPDWWAGDALAQFYGEDAALSRFLDLASSQILASKSAADVVLPEPTQLIGLTHAEKVLARRAIFNLLISPARGASPLCLLRLLMSTFSKREAA